LGANIRTIETAEKRYAAAGGSHVNGTAR